jgi:hypothetical protein
MHRFVGSAGFAGFAFCFVLSLAARSFAQSTGAFPEPAEPPPAAPAPAPPPGPPPPLTPVPPVAPTAAPAPAPQPPPPAAAAPTYSEPPLPPPPPQRPEDEGFKLPPMSIRVDPFLWLFDGKLAFELEVGIHKYVSVELVPLFVVNQQPPTFNYFVGREDPISRESNGLGPLAGTSLGLGFWLSGKPLEGTVIRAIFTNYSYHYVAADERGEFDSLSHVERHLYGYFGSHSKWGAFTLAGGFGLGADINHEERCFKNDAQRTPTSQNCPDGELLIKADRAATTVVDLNNGLGGVQILVRFSLGVAFN